MSEQNNEQYFQEITDVDGSAPVRSDIEFLVVQSDSDGTGKVLVRQGVNNVATALKEAGLSGGWSNEAKQALLDLLANVVYDGDNGPTLRASLESALYPPTSISAVFVQGQNVIYNTDALDTLKQYLTVTATYEDNRTETITDYTLSGSLTVGTSTITVSYAGLTDTFNVAVTKMANGLTDGTYTANNGTVTVSDNVISFGATQGSNRRYSIPFQHAIELHTGDVVVFSSAAHSENDNGALNIGFNGQLFTTGSTFCPFRATPIDKTVTIGTDTSVTSLYIAPPGSFANKSFTFVMRVNGEEVF